MKNPPSSPDSFRFQRWAMGGLAVLFLAIGTGLYFEDNPDRQFVCGLFIRVGLLLGAIWLAWPQLAVLPRRVSPLAAGIVLVLLFLAASRPKLFPILIGVLGATWLLNVVLRRFTMKR